MLACAAGVSMWTCSAQSVRVRVLAHRLLTVGLLHGSGCTISKAGIPGRAQQDTRGK